MSLVTIYIFKNPSLDPNLQVGVVWEEIWKKKHCKYVYVYIYILSSWWFQPIWKILVEMGIFPK